MPALPIATDDRQRARVGTSSVKTYAKVGGVLFLFSAMAGGFGEFFVPSQLIVSGRRDGDGEQHRCF
jgi:hypothetical protein